MEIAGELSPSPDANRAPIAAAPKRKRQLHPAMEAHKWRPGESGNKNGRPKRKPITELYEELLNDPENIETLRRSIIKVLGRGQMAMVLLLREMAERVEGKVTQPIDGTVDISLSERMSLAGQIHKARERAAMEGKIQ